MGLLSKNKYDYYLLTTNLAYRTLASTVICYDYVSRVVSGSGGHAAFYFDKIETRLAVDDGVIKMKTMDSTVWGVLYGIGPKRD